jgi:tetratricopeptide (TPR) repeat protein
MKRLLLPILLICTIGSLFCQEISVEYIEGLLEIKTASVWKEVSFGDVIPDGASLRLADDTLVELSKGEQTIVLSSPGIYEINELLRNSSKQSKTRSIILNLIQQLFQAPPRGKSAVLGVRAADIEGEEFSWVDEGYSGYISNGKDQLEQKHYDEAKTSFLDALDSAFEDLEKEEVLFYLGYVETLLKNPAPALAYLIELSPKTDAPYYNQAFILKATLLVESFASRKAILWISSFKGSEVDTILSLTLLEGLCHLQLGEVDRAQDLFNKVISTAPESGPAKIAQEYLESM